MINFFKLIAGSMITLYLVCAGFLVMSVNAENHASDNSVSSVVAVPAENASDSNIVSDALDAQPKWMQLLANVIMVASAIAAALPNTSARTNVILKGLRWLIDVGALNVFNAKNQDKSKPDDRYLN